MKSATITWVDSGELCGGHPLLYHLTRKERSADCPDCTAGVCVQRIESCAAWPRGQVLLVHGQQRTAN